MNHSVDHAHASLTVELHSDGRYGVRVRRHGHTMAHIALSQEEAIALRKALPVKRWWRR